MKLELKHLAPYLPYNLKIQMYGRDIEELEIVNFKSGYVRLTDDLHKTTIIQTNEKYYDNMKPILRPLTDFKKLINIDDKDFVPISKLESYDEGLNIKDSKLWLSVEYESYLIDPSDYADLPYWIFKELISWHFDVFGLIEKGLAIDINALKQ